MDTKRYNFCVKADDLQSCNINLFGWGISVVFLDPFGYLKAMMVIFRLIASFVTVGSRLAHPPCRTCSALLIGLTWASLPISPCGCRAASVCLPLSRVRRAPNLFSFVNRSDFVSDPWPALRGNKGRLLPAPCVAPGSFIPDLDNGLHTEV